ncbi:MAG: ribonuclease HII [Chitinophagales bacterium]|nr:ribonuclease HII [Chitinophagales bacterium]
MLTSHFSDQYIEAGCDEAGRGCLAGPVFAAAVIMPRGFEHPLLNDSKQLSERKRYEARKIVEKEAISWAVAQVDPKEIDEINILRASFLAMHRAIEQLEPQPELLLIDGNRFYPQNDIPFECIIKGDGKFMSIAAASILAKTYRDDYMMQIAAEFPYYDWKKNKGYPTKAHRLAIQSNGPCIHHRQSFRLLPNAEQGKLF